MAAKTIKKQKADATHAPKAPLRPFLIGFAVMLLVLGLFNAQLIGALIKAYVIPDSSQISETQLSDTYGGDSRIVIPKINVDAPVVYGMQSILEEDVQPTLQQGVLHFGSSALPGFIGNAVYVGHSSGLPWSPGDYNFVFLRLSELETGDKIYAYLDGQRYEYRVYDKKTVKPNNVSVLESTDGATITLITCTPVGTNINRLVVHAQLIGPEPKLAPENVVQLSDQLSEQELPGESADVEDSIRALFGQ